MKHLRPHLSTLGIFAAFVALVVASVLLDSFGLFCVIVVASFGSIAYIND